MFKLGLIGRFAFLSAATLAFWLANVVCFAQKPELVVEAGHSQRVYRVAFSPDGKKLASSSHDSTIKIWDPQSGHEIFTLKGHGGVVDAIAFSYDGKMLASGAADATVKLWNVSTGELIRTLPRHHEAVDSVAFSPDGKTVAVGVEDGEINLYQLDTATRVGWQKHSRDIVSLAFTPDGSVLASASYDKAIVLTDVATGRTLSTLERPSAVYSMSLSGDGKTLVASGDGPSIQVWEVSTGRLLHRLETGSTSSVTALSSDGVLLASCDTDSTKLWNARTGQLLKVLSQSLGNGVAFSPDSQSVAVAGENKTIEIWNVQTGKLRRLGGHTNSITALAVSPDGKTFASSGNNYTIKLWQGASGKELRTLKGHEWTINALAFSPNGKLLASGSSDGTIKFWDVATGSLMRSPNIKSGPILSLTFNADGSMLITGTERRGNETESIRIWDVTTCEQVQAIQGQREVHALAISHDGKMIASGSRFQGTVIVWDAATGREIYKLASDNYSIYSVAFSADGKTLATSGHDPTVKLWDMRTGTQIRAINTHSNSLALSPNGQQLFTASDDQSFKLWDSVSGRELHTFKGHTGRVTSVVLSADQKFLFTGGEDATIKIWRVRERDLLTSLWALDDEDWAVVMADGRFDASARAQKIMYWRVASEPIELEQLKERYYEPGLLAKLLNGDPLSEVASFENPKLFPEVTYEPPAPGSSMLAIGLKNRGSGIGRVQILVNGKEFLADARDDRLRQNPNVAQATLNVDLVNAPGVIAGSENAIRVLAWNVENYISSRGDDRRWIAGGATNVARPEVYAIVAGVSQYASAKLNLRFPAKDAVDFANVIEMGAKRLFGADKVHLTLLSTANDPRTVAPTKENFAKAFAAARQAKPTDILIVYFAGHAITLQRGSDVYCYLTQEARTTDTVALSDPEVRRRETITSDELIEWIKQIPANKQAVILDTCAAGAAKNDLAAMRDANGDAIRAVERAKDRTGSHILMGSAADAVAYETSHYGQGLLTYALLKGMKGPALRNDQFVDISALFHFAREEVEQLAKNIDKIQKPVIFAPNDESFDVGQLNLDDKRKITLASPKPIILRPLFLDLGSVDDTIDLMKKLRELLRDETLGAPGMNQGVLMFVDDDEYPGGIRPTGAYTVTENRVSLTLRLKRDGVDLATAKIDGAKEEMAAKVLAAIKAAIGKL